MYAEHDYKTKQQLKDAVKAGVRVRIFAPGLGTPVSNGKEFIEGPHYPRPHTWYAEVVMKDGLVVKVK
jgi:hypothetical protein